MAAPRGVWDMTERDLISDLRKQRQEATEYEGSLGYILRPWF